MKTIIATVLVIIGALMIFFLIAFNGDLRESRYSRNLHCDRLTDQRAAQIYRSIEKYQEYEFTGHAMISFGYRTGFNTTRKAWCELHISMKDQPLLKKMEYDSSLDPQLENGAGFLLKLLESTENPDLYPPNDIFSPKSPNYILKEGCDSSGTKP